MSPNTNNEAQRGSSSKRGIKTNNKVTIANARKPREGHPAKEGLRHIITPIFEATVLPREGHPAKEGLRHCFNDFKCDFHKSQRGSSSKRGIKTR